MSKIKPDDTMCALDYAFKRIGGKYKGRILWYLEDKVVLRYGELLRSLKDATPKMLTQTLKELEDDGLVVRSEYIEVPPRVEYRITPIGSELIPFIQHLSAWGEKMKQLSQCQNMAKPSFMPTANFGNKPLETQWSSRRQIYRLPNNT
jgi:DNA-binding HxlR family transcriptional regulator